MNNYINEIINAIPDLVVIFDSDGKIVDVSQNILEFYNIDNKIFFIGKNLFDFVVPEQHDKLRTNFENLKTRGYGSQQEYKLLKGDGSFFHGALNTKAFHGANEKERYFITIIRDITQQKILLEELNNSQKMFQLVLDNIPQHIFWKDIDSKFLGCNTNFAHVAGVGESKNIAGKTDFDLPWKNEEAESFHAIEHLVMESNTPEYHVIESQLQADGKQAWLDINRIPLRNSEGKVIGLLGTYEDITERKIAEENLKEKSEELTWINTIIILGNESTSLDIFIEKIFEYVLPLLSFSGGGLYIFDPDTQINTLTYHKNVHPDFKEFAFKIKMDEDNFSKYKKNQIHVCKDASKEFSAEKTERWKISSYVGIPITARNEYKGNLNLFSSQPHTFQKRDLNFLESIGQQIGIIIKKFESEKLLRKSEEKYRNLFENSPIAMLEQDYSVTKHYLDFLKESGVSDFEKFYDDNPEEVLMTMSTNKLVDCNRKALELYKANSKEDLILRMKRRFNFESKNKITDKVLKYNKKEILSLLEGKTAYEAEIISKTLTGEKIYLYAKSSILPGYESTWSKVIVSLIDITEVKIAEEKLKKSERKYRNIVENSVDGIILTNEKGLIIEWNQGMEKITGFTQDEALGRPVWEVQFQLAVETSKSRELKEQLKNGISSLLDKRENLILPQMIEQEIQDRNGTCKIVQTNSNLIFTNIGLMISTTMRDISNLKQAEQKLKESEEKFRSFAELSLLGIIIIQDNEIKYINKAFVDIYGLEIDDIKDWGINEMAQTIHPDYREFFIETLMLKKSGNFKIRGITKLGKTIWTDTYLKTILYDGKPAHFATIIDITKQRQAEEDLKESEEKYKAISENANDLITIFNENFVYEYINEKQYLSILGYSVNDLIGNVGANLLHPEEKEKILKEFGRVLKEGNATVYVRLRHKMGHYVWTETSGNLFYDRDGIRKVLTISRDISERIKRENKLKESEEKYRNLFENSPIALMEQDYSETKRYSDRLKVSGIVDFKKYLDDNPEEIIKFLNKTRVIDVNKKALELFNAISKDDFLLLVNQRKDSIISRLTEEVLLANKKEILSLTRGETEYESEYKSETFTEDLLYIYSRRSIVPGFESTWSNVIVSFQDITERKIAEEKLKESEEKFRSFAEQSLIGISILQDFKIKYINHAFSEILGYPINEVRAWGITDIAKTIHPEDLENIMTQLNKEHSKFTNFQFRGVTKADEIKWIDIYLKTINYEGNPALFANINDITESKKAEEKMIELDQIRKDLITRISHELRTPLTSIYGVSQMLLRKTPDLSLTEEILPYIEISHRGILRLKELIENLLDSSQLDNQKLELRLESGKLNELVNECIEELSYLIKSRDLEINFDSYVDHYHKIDKNRLSQAIINIISNAIKNTPSGGKISLKLKESKKFIDIIIKDTGVGITEVEKKLLFEKFGKIERYGQNLDVNIEGAGLGLYISKEIVELHGGKILVESEGRNKGAAFTIRLFKNE